MLYKWIENYLERHILLIQQNEFRVIINQNIIHIFDKNIVNVAMRMERSFNNLFMNLYNIDVLEYAQIY